jgi:hypothetical protein
MTRNFRNPSGARNPGGTGISRSAYRADTPRELPSGSILPFVSPLERNGVLQTLLDVSALGFIAFLLSILAVGSPAQRVRSSALYQVLNSGSRWLLQQPARQR